MNLYFEEHLSKKYSSLSKWIDAVKADQVSSDYEVQVSWARDLEEYVLTRTYSVESPSGTETKAPTVRANATYISAIKSFLTEFIGKDRANAFKFRILSEAWGAFGTSKPPVALVTWDEIRKLALEAKNKRDRAIITTGVSGLAVAEWISVFGGTNWFTLYDKIKSRKAPMRVEVYRKKEDVRYWTLLSNDGVDCLADLLDEREREVGRPMTKNDVLFVTQEGKPMADVTVQHQVRYLADKSGIDPTIHKLRHVYRVRFHEFRDSFKTLCANEEIPNEDSEFLLGHTVKIDPLLYNKKYWTDRGEETVRKNFDKLLPTLNVLTRRGGQPKKEENHELRRAIDGLALWTGMTFEEAKKEAIYHIQRLADFRKATMERIQSGEYKGEGLIEEMLDNVPLDLAWNIAESLPYEQVRPALIEWSKARNPATQKIEQKVVPEPELQKYLDEGWTFRSTVNHQSVLVERPKKA